MATADVTTVNSTLERVKLALVLALVVAGFFGYYAMATQALWLRGLLLGGCVLAALLVFLVSDAGRRFVAYVRDSARELQKVVWPTRRETFQMTLYVFGFAVVMAIFLWLIDKLLEWLLYGVVLGWRG
jgi:preprotein translocase subunit SecE